MRNKISVKLTENVQQTLDKRKLWFHIAIYCPPHIPKKLTYDYIH